MQTEKRLYEDFENLCNWFVDNKLSIYFGEDKAKSVLFASKRRTKNIRQLNIKYKDINIKQHSELDKMHHISDEDFRFINWLPTNKRVDQCINTITFKFVNDTCPYYLKEIFEFAPHCRIDTRNKFAKLKIPFRKTNMGQKAISFVGPSLWNSLPELIEKNPDNLNTFKHNVKNYCLN